MPVGHMTWFCEWEGCMVSCMGEGGEAHIAEHEKGCIYNPDARSCCTCEHVAVDKYGEHGCDLHIREFGDPAVRDCHDYRCRG